MKLSRIWTYGFTVLTCLGCCLSSSLAQDKAAAIRHTSATITIDGVADDDAWASANEYENFENAGGAEVEGPADASAKWKALWDEDNLYFFIEVQDDQRFTDTSEWKDDSVELYIDAESLGKGDDPVTDYRPADNQFGPLPDEIPEDPAERAFPIYQLTIIAGQDQIYNGVNHRTWVNSHPDTELDLDDDNKAKHLGVTVDTETSYTLEIALPWESLGAATPLDILDRGSFGFGIAINDNDVGGDRESQIMWATDLGDLWNNPQSFPDVELLFPEGPGPDVFVKKSLDLGQLSAAEPSISQVLVVSNVGIDNALTITQVSASGTDGGLVTIDESPTTIAPGAVGEIKYTLTPGRTGAFNFNIDIESDDVDDDDKAKTVAITASVINFAGPAVHYTMDGDAGATELLDVTGYNRHGTLDGATLGGAGLAAGESMSVSGGSQGIIPAGFNPSSFSVSMWVQPSELSGAQTLISHGVGNPTFAILAQGGDLNWFAGGAPEFGATGAIAAGTTYHVVATYSSDQAVLYIDGASVGVQDGPVEVALAGSDSFFIGAFDGGLPFSGLIDDVQIYDRVISEEDVAFLFGNPGDVIGSVPDGELPAGAIAGGPELKGADGLAAFYWNTEPKSTPTTDNPMHRADGSGPNAGWVDENVFNATATGSFSATTFSYEGNDLTPIAEWLGSDSGSFTGTESDLDEGIFRMVGYVYVEVPGDRTFTMTSDDGSVLYINDELVIDNDNGHGNATVSGDVNFPAAGYYPVDLRYFNGDWTNADGDHGGANFIADAGFTDLVQTVKGVEPFYNHTVGGGDGGGDAPLDVLFLGADDTGESGADASVLAFLGETFGVANTRYLRAGAADGSETADVIVFSSTFGSGDVRGKFHNSPVPIVNWEEAVMDTADGEFGQSLAVMTKSTDTTQMALGDHPIAGDLAGTTIDYLTAAGAETLGSTELSSGTDTVGTGVDGAVADLAMLFVTEAGAAVADTAGITDNVSPARRVAFPMTDATFDSLTDAGKQLFANSIRWAAGTLGDGNLLANGSFEDPAVDNINMNNLGVVPTGWSQTGDDATWNVIRNDGTPYDNGVDNAADGSQVLDLNGLFDIFQNFTVAEDTTVQFGASFANRSGHDGDPSTVGIYDAAGTTLVSTEVSVDTSGEPQPSDAWVAGQGSVMLAAGEYQIRIGLNNWNNVDAVFVRAGGGDGNGNGNGNGGNPGGDRFATLQDVGITGNGVFGVTVSDGVTADIEYSTDLQNWEVIAPGITGAVEETDAGRIAAPAGFYRAKQP